MKRPLSLPYVSCGRTHYAVSLDLEIDLVWTLLMVDVILISICPSLGLGTGLVSKTTGSPVFRTNKAFCMVGFSFGIINDLRFHEFVGCIKGKQNSRVECGAIFMYV